MPPANQRSKTPVGRPQPRTSEDGGHRRRLVHRDRREGRDRAIGDSAAKLADATRQQAHAQARLNVAELAIGTVFTTLATGMAI